MSRKHPRSSRLKRRPLIRALFRRGDPQVARVRAGSLLLVARLVRASQLPPGTRVQLGVATRRDLRGVARNRRRRQLREGFRAEALPALREAVARKFAEDVGMTVMVMDGDPARRPTGSALVTALSESIPHLLRRLQPAQA